MGFDRNTVIGFALLAVLFMGYFWYVSNNQKESMAAQQRVQDSLARLKPKVDSAQWRADSVRLAQRRDSLAAGSFVQNAGAGTDSTIVIENELIKASFATKGGWLKQVELKKHIGPDGKTVKMGGGKGEYFGYAVNTGNGQSTETARLLFSPEPVVSSGDSLQTLRLVARSSNGTAITHSFTVKKGDYRIHANIGLTGTRQLVSGNTVAINWQTTAVPQQKDVNYEKTQTRLVYQTDGEYDYNTAFSGVSEKLSGAADWVGLKQQFFNSSLVSTGQLNAVSADVLAPADTNKTEIATLKLTAQMNLPASGEASLPITIYYGPNDYHILKSYDNGMHNIVDLGSGVFAFVKWLNRWLILPVFEFLSKLMGSPGGWTILLLTIFIRLLIAPLTYSSYLSGAKMKALRPEIDAMKARLGNDQQAVSMEQMKLFREAGVNPLGGCIPALLQIPIFFALYSFFNANLDLRGVPFLWATDLSAYDTVLNFGFDVPLYGDHISLFTITACVTSMLISIYSMSTTPDTGNPLMKYMPYIFPVMMLFIFNKLPSALTWYYTVSNVITLVLQFVIQNYIINHDKILAEISANKAKPKKKSKWAERLEAMQEAQKRMDDTKKKGGR